MEPGIVLDRIIKLSLIPRLVVTFAGRWTVSETEVWSACELEPSASLDYSFGTLVSLRYRNRCAVIRCILQNDHGVSVSCILNEDACWSINIFAAFYMHISAKWAWLVLKLVKLRRLAKFLQQAVRDWVAINHAWYIGQSLATFIPVQIKSWDAEQSLCLSLLRGAFIIVCCRSSTDRV